MNRYYLYKPLTRHARAGGHQAQKKVCSYAARLTGSPLFKRCYLRNVAGMTAYRRKRT